LHKQNLHNHTVFSDGSFLPEEIIEAAIDGGMDLIGISDHFFTTKVFREISYQEWYVTNWKKYLSTLAALKDYYADRITVAAGIEIDSCLSRTLGGFEKFPWCEINENLDYVLIEYVGETCVGGMPFKQLEELCHFCSVPLILAHSDLDYLHKTVSLPKVFESLRKNSVALEVVGGKRNRWFFERFDPELLRNVKLSIGCDVHHEIEDVSNIIRAMEFIEKNGFANQVLFVDAEVA